MRRQDISTVSFVVTQHSGGQQGHISHFVQHQIFLFILAKRLGSPDKQTHRTDKQCSFGRKIIRKSYNQTPGKTIPQIIASDRFSSAFVLEKFHHWLFCLIHAPEYFEIYKCMTRIQFITILV